MGLRAAVAAVLALGLALLTALPSPAETPQAARAELRARLERLWDQRDRLDRALAASAQEVKRVEAEIIAAAENSKALAAKEAELAQRLERIRRQEPLLAQELAQARDEAAHRLRAVYLYGRDASAWLWGDARGLHEALGRAQDLEILRRADLKRLAELKERRQRLQTLKGELILRQNELVAVQEELAVQGEALARLRQRHRDLTAELTQRRQDLDTHLKALAEAEARLARTFALEPEPEAGQESQSGETGILAAKGRLSPPVEGKVLRAGGAGGHGLVLAARPGAPVRAPWSGRVIYAAELTGYGQVVILDHGHRVHTVLGFLAGLSVQSGIPVAAGEVLGAVGPSGELLVEVRRQAKPVDPRAWLRLGP